MCIHISCVLTLCVYTYAAMREGSGHIFKRALYALKTALYTLKRAVYTLKRALYTFKRALCTRK